MAIYEHLGVAPRLGEGVFVADGAVIIGDVVLGEKSSVWFNTVVRGDVFPIRIGSRTNVQDGSVVHVTGSRAATAVGDDVTVGHMVLLHGCTVGDRTLIGMGSVVLDGAVVGEECVVAAGSLITPNTIIPPRSFVIGSPARVKREVTDDDVAWVLEAGRLYVEYARNFREHVRRIG